MWVSRRRRPITSPPGGGTTAGRTARAAAPRAGTRRGSRGRVRGRGRSSRTTGAVDAYLVRTGPGSRPRRGRRGARPSPRRRGSGQVREDDHLGGKHGRGRGSAERVLVPDARIVPESGRPPWMTNDCMRRALSYPCSGGDRTTRGRRSTRYTRAGVAASPLLAVEASTRWYARATSARMRSSWGCTAFLHDFD